MELFLLFVGLLIIQINGQSNIDLQGNAIEYQGEGLPEQTILDGKVTKLDELSPVIFLNRTKALLNCAEGLMQIELKFDEPFYGIAYADFNRNSPCQIIGKGELTYSLDLPLKGCGTYQDPLRVFTNNIVVRFHPSLEIDGDETITVVCRYPSPIVPPPPGLSRYIKNDEPPQSILSAPLNGTQILFIMCAVLFLTLVLFGLAGSYYCIRHRRVAIVRRNPYSLGSSSEITKLSGSSRGSNGFEELKIPRLNTELTVSHSSSGSEGALIPSDYPSETFSEIEDVENRSIQISSGGSYENKAYIQETDNFYSEKSFSQSIHPKVKVRKPTVVMTTDEISTMKLEKNLTSILEERPIRKTQTTEEEHYEWNEETVDQTTSIFKPIQREKITTEELNESMYTEENTMMKTGSQTPPPPITPNRGNQKATKMTTTTTEELTEETLEEYEMRKRMMRLQNNENTKWDVRMRKISIDENHDSRLEWENFSDISSVSNMTMTPKLERARFSAAPVHDLSNERKEPLFSPDLVGTLDQRTPHSSSAHHYSREMSTSKSYISQYNIPLENSNVINWEVLIRVFQPEKYAEANIDSETLTVSDKMAWKKIIMNESSLRNDLIRASGPEDFVRISCDRRYKSLFEPHKWDVLIRLLSVPSLNGSNFDNFSSSGSSRKSNSESSSRKNSLPTLYEHETERKSSAVKKESSKMSTKSSYKSDAADLRSMSEMTVELDRIDCNTHDYGRYDEFDGDERHPNGSASKMYTIRSSSPNSLVRSASEFTEFWVPPQQQPDSELSSIYSAQTRKMQDSNVSSKRVSKESKFFSKQQSNSNWFDDNESDSSYRF